MWSCTVTLTLLPSIHCRSRKDEPRGEDLQRNPLSRNPRPIPMLELDKVHNLDCFSATTQIPNDGVDAVITDPPYPNRMNLFDGSLVDGLAMLYLACKKAKKYVVFFWNPFDV